MSTYLDRLRTLSYTSPTAKSFTASFDELARSGGKKSAVHELPQQDKAIVQDLGKTATRFPISLYFSGHDYDKTADSFYEALGESGPGTLSHPRWGDVTVLALSYSQKEAFVDGAGRAVFDVEFVIAPATPAVTSIASTAAAISAHVTSIKDKASAALAASFGSPSLLDRAGCVANIKASIKGIKKSLAKIVSDTSELGQSWNAAILTTVNDLSTLLESPADFARAILEICTIPTQAACSINAKLLAIESAYTSLPDAATSVVSKAQAALAVLFRVGLTTAAASAVTEGTLSSRSEALAAHDNLVSHYRKEIAAVETAEAAGSYTSDPAMISSLAALSAEASAYLLNASFSLRIERRVTLDAAATPLSLIYKFYSAASDLLLDEFCEQNHLQGDELLVVPIGREVRYYVA